MQTCVDATVARIQAWLKSQKPREIAAKAKLDEKTLRLAVEPGWNPRADTLSKLEPLVPSDFMPPAPKKRARAI